MSTASISFGLVTIPVRIYPAIVESGGVSFHLLHSKDGARLKQQLVCPEDNEVVSRSEAVRGYEYPKGSYVTFTDEELKALDEAVTQGIEIAEFVPRDAVDPVYFDRTYYLGPDKGGDKPYALLAQAMDRMGLMAVARHAARGKDYLVLLRTVDGRIHMHQLHHSDEVRPVSEVPAAERSVKEAELKLARQLIDQIASDSFRPERYEDQVRKRVKKAIAEKAKGGELTPAAERKPKAEIIDLMAALKASLGKAKPEPERKSRGRAQRKAS